MLKVSPSITFVLVFLSCSQPVTTLSDLKGLEESEVISIYGKPEIENSYTMGDDIVKLEINGNLLSYFPGDSSIQIRDMVWDKVGFTVKVWLYQSDSTWEVIDAIKYNSKVRF